MTGLRRRAVLAAGLLAALAGPAAAKGGAERWTAYEARLRARLADAGGGRFDATAARDLLALNNDARRQAGAPDMAWSEDLAEAARAHAADLAARAYVEHLTPEGFDPTDRLGLVARRMIGSPAENIAYHRGPRPAGAAGLMDLWRDSPPHWANLLRPKHSHAGFGVARKADRAYAVGLYARPDAELGAPLPFRPGSAGEVLQAMRGLPRTFIGFWLDDELHEGRRLAFADPRDRVAAVAGVYRLRLDRSLGGRVYESLYGPIFVWRGG